ncbi:hypothetical protein CIHG_05512 [Coccidioides immitis H538.4]|uniref:Uncharacterized protein n=1 Tax=Coccidioides immitis H538.4 TaxID=396776 RepID=A0A0J8UJU2_COCIT|nr:hypothetical protein CIHG_05512 [Coccidioides immitis H538.4]
MKIAISEIRFTGYPIEVWYVAFYLKTVEHKQIPVLFAGDDMQHVRGVTLEEIECAGNVSSRAWQLDDRGRCHDAGVTAIVPLFADEGMRIKAHHHSGNWDISESEVIWF